MGITDHPERLVSSRRRAAHRHLVAVVLLSGPIQPRALFAAVAFPLLLHAAPVSADIEAPAAIRHPASVPPTASGIPSGSAEIGPAADRLWRDPQTGIEFVLVPGGEFDMGSEAFANEKPVHRVRVVPFWLARTEVTQAQWLSVMGARPAKLPACDDCPVGNVNWQDVLKFLQKTSYRLPTEAEWEFAAGGGAEHQRWAGTDNEDDLDEYAWYRGNSANEPHPVGLLKPNRFGLFDMSGNVYEWCADWYDADYYRHSPVDDPTGPPSGNYRVARGGSWILDPRIAGVTFRLRCLPSRRRIYLGFRPALTSPP